MTSLLHEVCGVRPGAADHDVLGVTPQPTRQEISNAIDARLQQIAAHADGAANRGVEARTQVVIAARRLMREALAREREQAGGSAGTAAGTAPSAPRAAPASQARSSPQDEALARELASILRRCGGWNERSRRRVMAWASERRINGDQLRSAFARVMGQRPTGVRRATGAPTAAESTLPQAAMEGLAASIDVVIDSPGKRITTWALVAAGVLLSLGTVLASYWAWSSRSGEESAQHAESAQGNGTASGQSGENPQHDASSGGTTSAASGATGGGTATSRETNASTAPPARGGSSATPQQPSPVLVHRDGRIDPLLAAWSRASAATWAGFGEDASAAQTMALLERTHALLCVGTHLLQTDLDGAASLQEVIPEEPIAREASPALPTAEAPDQALAASLRQAGRAASSRRKALDVFRAAASGRIARDDAAALASTAFGDEAREVRRVAQELILDRYTASPSMVLAMVESLPLSDEAHGAESRDFVASFLGSEASIPVRAGREWATRALAERALLAMDAPSISVDRIADALRATVAARAVALGASPAVATSQPSADGAASMVAERLIDLAPAKEAQRLRARLADRLRAADGAPQRFAAVQWSMLDATASGLVSRWPRLRAPVEEIVRHADRSRASASTVLQQLAVDAAALLSLQDLELQTMLRPGGPA